MSKKNGGTYVRIALHKPIVAMLLGVISLGVLDTWLERERVEELRKTLRDAISETQVQHEP